MRHGALCLCAVMTLACAGAVVPVAASAALGGNAFNELAEGQQETTTTNTTTTAASTESSSGSNSTVIAIAIVAAVVLLAGIVFVIVRDARKVAPAGDGLLGEGRGARDSAARLRKRRARAKAARQQRKRNR
jgi:hypothetical protein